VNIHLIVSRCIAEIMLCSTRLCRGALQWELWSIMRSGNGGYIYAPIGALSGTWNLVSATPREPVCKISPPYLSTSACLYKWNWVVPLFFHAVNILHTWYFPVLSSFDYIVASTSFSKLKYFQNFHHNQFIMYVQCMPSNIGLPFFYPTSVEKILTGDPLFCWWVGVQWRCIRLWRFVSITVRILL
jgi:hypothetical protein